VIERPSTERKPAAKMKSQTSGLTSADQATFQLTETAAELRELVSQFQT